MAHLFVPADPRVVVGMHTSDDAGVMELEGTDQLLIQTVDFITPVCDDPYWFGRVAAANSLSDIYAMGGRPISALNVCCFPSNGPLMDQYAEILRGGLDVIRESDAVLLGGQSVKDAEIKYGLSVTGVATRDRVTPNSGARPGDVLILTKPIGTGVIINGARAGIVDEQVLMATVRKMAVLNRDAAEVAARFDCRGATDITGFGLAGHGWELAAASNVALEFVAHHVPVFADALSVLAEKHKAGKITGDVKWAQGAVSCDDAVPVEVKHLFADPQTSGGLLLCIASSRSDDALAALRDRGVNDAAIVGRVTEATEGPVLRILA